MYKSIGREELRELIEAGAVQVVDVLPQPEFLSVHIPTAVNLPLRELDEKAVASLDRNKPVAVYCHDGL